jgi:hypothetical protein
MEVAIEYTTNLVESLEGSKVLTFSFPSKIFSTIFLDNLVGSLHEKRISPLNGLEINIFIPESPEEKDV